MASPAAFGQIFLLQGHALRRRAQASYRAFRLMWGTPERLWGLVFFMGEMIYIPLSFHSQTHSKSEVNVYPGFEQSFIPIIIPLNIGGSAT